jgi:predicted flap endonuclease-1-like 5' DNA nuclease
MLWVAIIVVIVIIVLLLWWWLSRCPDETAPAQQPARPPARVTAPPPAVWRGEEAEPQTAAAAGPAAVEAPAVAVEPPTPTSGLAAEMPAVGIEPSAPTPIVAAELPVPAPEVAAEAPVVAAEPSAPDDLKIIEGIGPKISAMLNAEGIHTFAQLAATDVERLRGIMVAANLRIADPTTWPQQAALAAAGKWDELQALQDSLKAGRRA